MEQEQFASNEQVKGSSPFVPSLRLRSSMDLERKITNLEVARSSRAGAFSFFLFRSRPTGRTPDFESGNRGSNPFSEARFISGRSADDYTGLFWKQVFAGLNPAAQTNFSFYADVAQQADALVLGTSW